MAMMAAVLDIAAMNQKDLFHSRLKNCSRRLVGVSSSYFLHFLGWFSVLERCFQPLSRCRQCWL